MSEFILTTHADSNPLVAALRQEGVVVERVNWPMQPGDLNGCLGFYGNLFDEIKDWSGLLKLRGRLRQAGVPYVFWNRDAPWNVGMKCYNRWALRLIKPVDIYLTHSLQDKNLFGGEAHYFPNAAQPAYYQGTDLQALRDESLYMYDVSYFGSFSNTKDRNARLRASFLRSLEVELSQRRLNIRFQTIDTAKHPMILEEQLRLIRTSKINLNVGAMCDLSNKQTWGLPERIFGIPAAGGLAISDPRKHLSETFPEDCIPTFDSVEGCATLIDQLLINWESLRSQAEKQHLAVMARHTYRHRAQFLLELLEQYRERRQVKGT